VSTQIAHYNIYKESSQNGLYYLVDTVNYHQISQWTDPAANPQIRSWKYKISIVDQCGDESPLSAEHKTIHLNVNQGLGGAYNLIWDEYTGFSYSSFNIFRYSPTGGWVQIAIVPANVLSYTDATPPVNTYDYKVEAVATFSCAPQSHAAINSTRSNIKTILVSPLGTDNVMLNEQVSLYPNPSEGTFSLSFPASTEGYQLKVYDAIGQVVYSSEISKEESSSTKNSRLISLGVHAPGLYFLTLDNNQTRIYKKLIVQ
jgi:hypothetical protein